MPGRNKRTNNFCMLKFNMFSDSLKNAKKKVKDNYEILTIKDMHLLNL